MKKTFPAPKPKIIHRAHLLSAQGDVSPLCADVPRKINLAKASWTNRDEAVTCPKCLQKLEDARTVQ